MKSVIELQFKRARAFTRKAHDRGVFHLLSVNGLTQFLTFGTSLLVAKFVSPVQLGDIRIIQSYTAVFIILAGAGFTTAVLRFVADSLSAEYKSWIMHQAIRRTLYASIASYVIFFVLAISGFLASDQDLVIWLVVYGLVIPLAALTNLFLVCYQALQRIKELAFNQFILKIISFVFIVVMTWQFEFPGFILSSIAAYIVGLVPLRRGLNPKSVAEFSAFPPNFNKISLYSLAGTLVTMIGQYADFFILDHYAMNREQIGHYSLAFLFVLGASQVTGTIQTISSPYFTAKSSDEVWFRKKLSEVQWKVCLLSVVVAVSVWCAAWLLMRNFFDPGYSGSMDYLAVLLIKYVVWSAYSIIGVALVGIGLIRSGFYLSLLTTPLVVGLGYMLLQNYGVIGVAWAQVIVAVFSGLCILLIARVELNRYFSAVDRTRLV